MTVVQSRMNLKDRYTLEDGSIYLSGVQALVRLPMDVRRLDLRNKLNTAAFISGYEGSPLAGYDLELGRNRDLLTKYEIEFVPGLNEELGANAVFGTQLVPQMDSATKAGVVGFWYGKAPGLDRATDALRHASLCGTHPQGGAVAIVGDDAIAKSSTVPSGSEIAISELGMPVLAPCDSQDVLDLGIHAAMMSRFSGLWVGLKIATNVADGASSAIVSPDRINPVFPDNRIDGTPYVHTPSSKFLGPMLSAYEKTMMGERLELARRYAVANNLNPVTPAKNAKIGIISTGIAHLDLLEALGNLGIDPAQQGIRMMKMSMSWPLIDEQIMQFAEGLDEIIVIEEKRPFVEPGIKDILYGIPGAPAVSGKKDPSRKTLMRADNDLGADVIAAALAARLSERLDITSVTDWLSARNAPKAPTRKFLPLLPLIDRTPFFCSGCPHNRSTVVPEGSTVGAGIGCHAMALLLPEDRVGNVIGVCQMGGEGAPWIGIEPFVEKKHLFQNIGDGTYHHSGSLAIRATIAAGVNITYKLLYNSAVAMTGGQEAVGGMSVPNIAQELLAEGVKRIVVTTEDLDRYTQIKLPAGVDVRHRDDLIEVQEDLQKIKGVTVLIHDQECATELRRKRKRKIVAEPTLRAFINERVCEGCGDCGVKSNCLSVQPVDTEFGRKTQIHQPSCNKDFSCLDGDCPSFITITPALRKGGAAKPAVPPIEATDLADPIVVVPDHEFAIRFTGIGGTGIVTVAQIVANAAVIAGRHVRTLDQLGLAQKGGAVVSDVKIGTAPLHAANKISAGDCDLYLSCDVLVGAADHNLTVANASKTVAIVSTSEVPTGAMVTNTAVGFPESEQTIERINAVTRVDHNQFVDARMATRGLFSDDQYANMFLIGTAYQSGALPVPAESIEEAIFLNGVAVEDNIQAFRRGRQIVSEPGAVYSAIDGLGVEHTPTDKATDLAPSMVGISLARGFDPGPLAELVALRAGELVDYQDRKYAKSYVSF
ncbi:MAG: indolepyruvate ferredoxin oxidoreductase family protein, partial [Antricoccus sp.]